MKTRILAGLLITLIVVIAGVAAITHQSEPQTSPTQPHADHEVAVAAPPPAPPPSSTLETTATPEPPRESIAPAIASTPQPEPVKSAPPQKQPSRTVVKAPKAPSSPNALIPEPMARQALNFVGADPEAEEIWIAAINDPEMSKHDRSNLIEDLNEDGFPDPKNITMADLPLVVNRIALIEELAPYAMDQTNADAFQEAYKDLVNMYARLAGY